MTTSHVDSLNSANLINPPNRFVTSKMRLMMKFTKSLLKMHKHVSFEFVIKLVTYSIAGNFDRGNFDIFDAF